MPGERVVVVTGGSQGIGLAAARKFVADGARVVVSARTAERAEATAKQLGPAAIGLPLLLQSASSCSDFATAVARQAGQVDVLVNNAAAFPRGTVAEMDERAWLEAFDVNVHGVFRLTRLLLPHLRRPGACIVNLVSGLAVTGGYSTGAYAATKAALIALTRTLGIELAADGIRVNALSPGVVDTELLNAAYSAAERARILSGMPGGKAGAPEDVAGTVAYLASAASHPMTGQVLFLRTPVALGAPK